MSLTQPLNLKHEIKKFVTKLGAFKVGVADASKDFEKTLEGCHPRDLMKNSRSVIVSAFNVGLDYYTSIEYEQSIFVRILHLYRDSVNSRVVSFLRKKGYDAMEAPVGFIDENKKIAYLSFKLAAYEAGIGILGRPSILITPEYGPRVNLGVVITEAPLEPDGQMIDFNPCQHCDVCVKICPVEAIKADKPPPTGFDRNKCFQFVSWIENQTKGKVKACGYCYNRCPAGKLVKKTLQITKWRTLLDITLQQRKRLIQKFKETT